MNKEYVNKVTQVIRGNICINKSLRFCYTSNPRISFNEQSTVNTDGYKTRIYDKAFMVSPYVSLCIDEDD